MSIPRFATYLERLKEIPSPCSIPLPGIKILKAPNKGWVLRFQEGVYFLHQKVLTIRKGDKVMQKHLSLRETLVRLQEDGWIYKLERVSYPPQIEQMTQEVELENEGLSPEDEQKVIDHLCKTYNYNVSITSKSHPLTILGTTTNQISNITDYGIQPTHKQGREFRSGAKNAIPFEEDAIDEWNIYKRFTVAFCDCTLFSGINKDQPCCDMIASTPYGRKRLRARYPFDSEKLLTNHFDGCEYEEYTELIPIEPGVYEERTRYRGEYIVGENVIHKLVSVHALKGMEFPMDKDLKSEDGRNIDLLIDIRSVKSKGAYSMILADHPLKDGDDLQEHLTKLWNSPKEIYSNGELLGKAIVCSEIFTTTKETSLMIGSSFIPSEGKETQLRIRPEAYGLSGCGYESYKEAIEPNLRSLEDLALLYSQTMEEELI